MSLNNSNFSILSLNVQSINAKFDELKITIEQINQVHTISVICIQESWLENESNNNLYQLDNYNLISKSKYSSEHGGLLIYVHTDFEYEPGLVGAIYRRYLPPVFTGNYRHAQYSQKWRLPALTGIYKCFIDFSSNYIVDSPSYSLFYTWTP